MNDIAVCVCGAQPGPDKAATKCWLCGNSLSGQLTSHFPDGVLPQGIPANREIVALAVSNKGDGLDASTHGDMSSLLDCFLIFQNPKDQLGVSDGTLRFINGEDSLDGFVISLRFVPSKSNMHNDGIPPGGAQRSGNFERPHLRFESMMREIASHPKELAVIADKKSLPDRLRLLAEIHLWQELGEPSQEVWLAAFYSSDFQSSLKSLDQASLYGMFGFEDREGRCCVRQNM